MTRHDSKDAARRRFFTAALRVCARNGFLATRMDQIATEAGRSKGALYHHFATKKGLFVELVHDLVETFSTSVDPKQLADVPARALIERTWLGLAESYGGADLFAVFGELLPLAARDPELRVPLLRYYERRIGTLTALLQWAQARGQMHARFEPEHVARALCLATDGIFVVSTALGDSDRAMADVAELLRHTLDGLMA